MGLQAPPAPSIAVSAMWDLQRQEDALPDEAAKREFRKQIPVPPKYTSADFLKSSYWKHRGKLDVPKERFVSYPGASRDGDPSLLVGWAGWDHREQAQALATLVVAREQEDGWDAAKLLPLVAGLREILPWYASGTATSTRTGVPRRRTSTPVSSPRPPTACTSPTRR
jgi:hypothetical protein